MATGNGSSHAKGPAIRAVDPWLLRGTGEKLDQLLSDDERARLARIASVAQFKKGEKFYCIGQRADTLFNVTSGIVKTYKTNGDGSEHIASFLYPGDLLGLSHGGHYTTSAAALTPVAAYVFPVSELRRLLQKDAALQYHVIAKLYYDLHQVHDHAHLLAQKYALSKLAIFLQLQERLQAARAEPTAEIYLPMPRSDIAKYVGMSLAAVSRGFSALAARRIICCRNRSYVQVIDRDAFEKLAGRVTTPPGFDRPSSDPRPILCQQSQVGI